MLVEVKDRLISQIACFLDFNFFVPQAWLWAQCATHSISSPLSSTGCPARRATRGRPTQPYTIFTGSQLGSSNALPLVSFGIFSSKYPPPLMCPFYLFLASIVAESQNKVMNVSNESLLTFHLHMALFLKYFIQAEQQFSLPKSQFCVHFPVHCSAVEPGKSLISF